MGKIIRNGRDYSGLNVSANGVFIDTDKILVSETQISSSGLSYSATEDCYVYLYLWGGNSTTIKINNIEVSGNYSSDKDVYLVPLKKGQTLTTTSGNANNTYTVYGVLQGTTDDEPFQITQISQDNLSNVSLSYNTNNLVKTLTLKNKGFYLLSIVDTYNRNSNRSYLNASSNDIIIYNSGERSITDVASDVGGYSTFTHLWFIQTLAPNTSLGLYWWGNGYNINSLSITLYQIRGSINQSLPSYSTTEHKTGRQWIDGRDIYEITFDVSANPIRLTNNWSTVGALAGVDFIVSATASCGGCIEGAVEVQYSGGNVIIERIGLNSGDTRDLTYLTVQYVKT